MKRYPVLGLVLAVSVWAADKEPPKPSEVQGVVVNALTREPIKKAEVTLRNTGPSGSVFAVSTDDSGAFSLVATEPGAYELVIQKRGFVPGGEALALGDGQNVAGKVLKLTPHAVIAGRVADGDGEPLPRVTVQAIQLRQVGTVRRYFVVADATTNDLGEYRIFSLSPGRYLVGAAYHSETGYAALYFPGVREAGSAVPVDAAPGGEVRGVNLTIAETHSLKVRGTVQGMTGMNVQGLMVVAAPCDAGPLNRSTTTVRNSTGEFELRDLTPGCYVLAADSFTTGKRFSARLSLTVADSNLEDVRMSVVPPVQLAGVVRVDGGAEVNLAQVVVNLESRLSKLSASGAPGANGALVLNNIVPEIYQLSVVTPEGYYLKSARFGETDVLQSGLDLSRGGSGGLELVLSGDGGIIDGSVTGEGERPVAGATVFLVSNTRLKVTVADRQGTFHFRGIPPGDYQLYAGEHLDTNTLQDPATSKGLNCTRVSVKEHDRLALQLATTGAPQQ
jgi:hypothetical protein